MNEEHVFTTLDNLYRSEKEVRDNNLGVSGVRELHYDPREEGIPFEEIKMIYQWLISKGYVLGSKIEITADRVDVKINTKENKNDSAITEKGMEYYKELSKKYDIEYWAKLAREKLSEIE